MLTHKMLSLMGRMLGKGRLSIVIYHQVFSQKDLMRPTEPTVETFRWQMELIKKFFQPLSISAAIDHINNGTLPDNSICVTFDDGYINNLVVATPVLNELNIPATVFIATAFSSGENMFNDRVIDLVGSKKLSTLALSALDGDVICLGNVENRRQIAQDLINQIKYLPYKQRNKLVDCLYEENGLAEATHRMMSKWQISELASLGIEIGAHTVDHSILKVLSPEEQKLQIGQSKAELEKLLGYRVRGFAYPNGKAGVDYESITRDIVSELSFDYAVSTNCGISQKTTDKFQLNRFTPWDKTPLMFHFRLIRNLIAN